MSASPAGERPDEDTAPLAVRSDIVEAATHVFSRLGYHGASMQDIAIAAGMRKASLYHHLRKKEDLLFAIHEGLVDELIQRTRDALVPGASPAEHLAAVLHAAMDFIASNREGVTVFLQEAGAVTGERWDGIVAKRDEYEQLVVDIVSAGISAGDFVDLPPKIATRGVLAMANWCYTWFDAEGEMSASDVADVFAAIAISGLQRRT